MYLNGGKLNGVRVLSRTTIETMMRDQTGTIFGSDDKYYGLAFGVVTEKGHATGGVGSPGTFDWGGYFNTQYFADPKEGTIGVIMKQTREQTDDETGWKFRLLVGQAIDD
jgi:CubicO group peptidase (beta-lactamase class C family)